jgi:proteasome lid subunit RPN8/RPN11
LNPALRIEARAWQTMLAHAVGAYPEECCGALIGGAKLVTRALPLENVAPSGRQARYAVRSRDLAAAEIEARRQGLWLVGIYHSHPDCAARFSDEDQRNACPWFSYLILSVRAGRVLGALSWVLNPERGPAPEEVITPEGACPPPVLRGTKVE